MVQKINSKLQPVSFTNINHDVTYLVNLWMVKNAKTWISWERSIKFLRNKKILNLCLRWHILRNYRFVAEVTFNKNMPIFGTWFSIVVSIYLTSFVLLLRIYLVTSIKTNKNINIAKRTKTSSKPILMKLEPAVLRCSWK